MKVGGDVAFPSSVLCGPYRIPHTDSSLFLSDTTHAVISAPPVFVSVFVMVSAMLILYAVDIITPHHTRFTTTTATPAATTSTPAAATTTSPAPPRC